MLNKNRNARLCSSKLRWRSAKQNTQHSLTCRRIVKWCNKKSNFVRSAVMKMKRVFQGKRIFAVKHLSTNTSSKQVSNNKNSIKRKQCKTRRKLGIKALLKEYLIRMKQKSVKLNGKISSPASIWLEQLFLTFWATLNSWWRHSTCHLWFLVLSTLLKPVLH